ncbi:MAG: type II secretion system protein J, partial [Thermomonas sp.]
RAVSEFLRRRIGGAQGIVFHLDQTTGQAQRFTGDARSMRFVADLPDYLGRGGPHLHELGVDGRGAGQALQVDFRMVMAGETVNDPNARPPEPLLEGLRSLRFSYRTLGDDGGLAPWTTRWEYPEALPMQVRVQIADAQGPWPELIIGLPLAASYGITPELGQ